MVAPTRQQLGAHKQSSAGRCFWLRLTVARHVAILRGAGFFAYMKSSLIKSGKDKL
jgi:hypothetical protein